LVLQLEQKRKEHHWTEEDIDLVKREYVPNKVIIRGLAERIGSTEGSIRARASRLGLTQPPKTWTQEEDERLCDLISRFSRRKVARKLCRSERSIGSRLSALKQSSLVKEDWFNAIEVALILGVESRYVYRCIKLGMLKANDHFSSDKNRGHHIAYHIERSELIEFIRKYPSELQGIRPDMVAFIDLLTRYS